MQAHRYALTLSLQKGGSLYQYTGQLHTHTHVQLSCRTLTDECCLKGKGHKHLCVRVCVMKWVVSISKQRRGYRTGDMNVTANIHHLILPFITLTHKHTHTGQGTFQSSEICTVSGTFNRKCKKLK